MSEYGLYRQLTSSSYETRGNILVSCVKYKEKNDKNVDIRPKLVNFGGCCSYDKTNFDIDLGLAIKYSVIPFY